LEKHVERSIALEKKKKIDLLVWPESAYAGALPTEFQAAGNLIKGDVRAPLLFGSIRVKNLATDPKFYNSALLLDREGKILGTYDKIHLLAFGEYIPLGDTFPFLYSLTPYAGRFWPGENPEALVLNGWRFAPLICYEDILANFTRWIVNETKPNVLVNLTNDAWFGKSHEPTIHLQLARLRSIEHHIPMIRSTNSGISAFIDPVGRVRAHSGVQTVEDVVDDVPKIQAMNTLYSLAGDWPGYFSLALCLFFALRPVLKK
jgi:apolipoprotein N-acyltransferase